MAETLWVTRDADGFQTLHEKVPVMGGRGWHSHGAVAWIPERWFPGLKPGECRQVTLVLQQRGGS